MNYFPLGLVSDRARQCYGGAVGDRPRLGNAVGDRPQLSPNTTHPHLR